MDGRSSRLNWPNPQPCLASMNHSIQFECPVMRWSSSLRPPHFFQLSPAWLMMVRMEIFPCISNLRDHAHSRRPFQWRNPIGLISQVVSGEGGCFLFSPQNTEWTLKQGSGQSWSMFAQGKTSEPAPRTLLFYFYFLYLSFAHADILLQCLFFFSPSPVLVEFSPSSSGSVSGW